jgi:NADH dehydrogenase FAD-containing subunit
VCAGVFSAEKLLKAFASQPSTIKVILVGPSSKLYWNLATPRGVIQGAFTDDKLFQSFLPAFEKYSADVFEFIEGTAEQLEPEKNSVVVKKASGEKQTLTFDYAILATGASTAGMPWKRLGNDEQTLATLHDVQSRIHSGNSILIAGGGPTGVETAGEIATKYTDKDITLVTNTAHLLPALKESVGKQAELELQRKNVKVLTNTKVESSESTGNQTKLSLSDGKTLTVDVYLPTVGLKANTSYVPQSMLDEAGNVKVDEHLRTNAPNKNIFAAGDVNSNRKQIFFTETEALQVATNLTAIINGKESNLKAYKELGMPMMMATVGYNKGVGQIGPIKVPSFVVTWFKGADLGSNKLPHIAKGDRLVIATSV